MKLIYTAVGFICMAAGAVGVFLPFIPTAPFLLAAAFLFAKSSDRLNSWFRGTKLYRNNLEDFVNGKGMTRAAKIRIMMSVTLVMAAAAFFMRNSKAGLICLAVVWVCHAAAILFFVKTLSEEGGGGNDDK